MTTANTNTDVKQPEANNGVRNFRQNPDIENFYRFVHDNALRHEAKVLFKTLLEKVKKSSKKNKDSKKNKH